MTDHDPTIADCTGIVLAGGTSRRMGTDKAMLAIGNETMLERALRVHREVFDEVVCIGREDAPGQLRVVPDELPGLGPLSGIAAAMGVARTGFIFVSACDMPLLTAEAISSLWQHASHGGSCDAIVPRIDGRAHPLFAFYRTALRPATLDALSRGELSVTRFATTVGACFVECDADDSIGRAATNVNTDAEYRALMADRKAGRRDAV